jgi:hypothetical protein
MSGQKSLSLGKLSHEFFLSARIVLVDIKEVVDSLSILLVELGTETSQNGF